MTPRMDSRRFRVLTDAFYVRQNDGVWLRNARGSFSIQGAGAYQLVDTLLRSLDGVRTIDELTGGLPDSARSSVLRLVDTLERNGFVRPTEFPPELVPAWMSERYAAHLAFLEHHADRPVTRMTMVRSRQVLCAGSGTALRGLLGALGEFGVARVLAHTTLDAMDDLADVTASAREADPRLRWRVEIGDDPLDPATLIRLAERERVALVLLASEAVSPTELGAVQRSLRAAGRSVGVLARCGEYLVAVPPSAAPDHCLECVYRWTARPVAGAAADLPPAPAQAAIAALHLVRHTFALLARVELPDPDAVVSVEPLTPTARTHTARRHPACPGHARPGPAVVAERTALGSEPVRPDIQTSHDPAGEVAASDRIVAVTTAWLDQVTGPLLALGEGQQPQLPLSASACRIADPRSTADTPLTRTVSCRALSAREARNQVVLAALERTAAGLVAGLPPGAVAAGWTQAEAGYRAQLALSRAVADVSLEWRAAPGRRGGPIREFLLDTLAAVGRAATAHAVEQLPTGLVRAQVLTAAGPRVSGLGVNDEHAVDNALLAGLAGLTGQADRADRADRADVVVAHVAPPVDSWAEALDLVAKQAVDLQLRDVSERLCFLGADAALMHAAATWTRL